MALKSECLCDGKIIGIESIYTVINGNQINIPEKVKELRKKSRNKELFCPCGCGNNLILVTSDRKLKEQHFRFHKDCNGNGCDYINEGSVSVKSKIILKCWLADKLNVDDIESRVPISAVNDTDRKYEFTHLSRNKKLGLVYSHERSNLIDEKLDIIENNSKGIEVIYVVDKTNLTFEGQYPEAMMKVQERQGYCIFLRLGEKDKARDYNSASISVAYYAKNIDGYWKEITVVNDKLNKLHLDINNKLIYECRTIDDLLIESKNEWQKSIEDERNRREKLKQENEIYVKKLLEERIRKEQQIKKWHEEQQEKRIEQKKLCRKQEIENKKKKENDIDSFLAIVDSGNIPQDCLFIDPVGRHWIKCKKCGVVDTEGKFALCDEPKTSNRGLCYNCYKS